MQGGGFMRFEEVLSKHFDKVFTEVDFVKKTYNALKKFGFNAANTIACTDVCRDEISQPLVTLIKEKWGEAFNLSSLAGMFFAGKTALLAAMHHAPIVGSKERYVYYAFPHIAIGSDGRLGVCKRRGRKEKSSACGALNVFLEELSNPPSYTNNPPAPPLEKGGKGEFKRLGKGGLKRSAYKIDNDDIEMSLIRMRLMKEIPYGQIPDLIELTKITRKVIQSDLEHAIEKVVDTKKSDYALMTGIQIHGPDGNYIWPSESYAVVKNKRKALNL
jgi:hypothetical protein